VPDASCAGRFAGTLIRYAPSFPGPIGTVTEGAHGTSRGRHSEPLAIARAPTSGRWIALNLEDLDSGRPPLAQSRGLVRIARSNDSDAGDRRLVFATREAADECSRRLAGHPGAFAQLRELGGIAGVGLTSWTAAELRAGTLKILWRRREPIVVGATPAAPPPPQAPRRTVAPSSPAAPTPEYSTFPPGLDALAVAQVLKDAAKDGVPFCEECMKAQAARDGTPAGAA